MILFQFTMEREMFSGLRLFALATRDTVPGTDRARGVRFFEKSSPPHRGGGGGKFFKYFLRVSVRFFVCLYPINIKTAEPIGPKFCVGPHMTSGEVYG